MSFSLCRFDVFFNLSPLLILAKASIGGQGALT